MKLELAMAKLLEKQKFMYTLQIKHGINVTHILESLHQKGMDISKVLIVTNNIDNYNNCREQGIESEFMCNFLDDELRDNMDIDEYDLIIMDRVELSRDVSLAFYLVRELHKRIGINALYLVNLDTLSKSTFPLLRHYTDCVSVTDSVVLPTSGWSKNLLHYYDKLRIFKPIDCKITKNIILDQPCKMEVNDIHTNDIVVVPNNALKYQTEVLRQVLNYQEFMMLDERLICYSDVYAVSKITNQSTVIPKGSFIIFKGDVDDSYRNGSKDISIEYLGEEFIITIDINFLQTLDPSTNTFSKVYYSVVVTPDIMDHYSFDKVLFLTYDSLVRNDILKTLRGTRNVIDIRYNKLYNMI